MQPRDGATAGPDARGRAARAAARSRLAGYKWPRSIDFVDELPRTGTGKILKRTLRAPYWEGTGRTI